MKIYAAIILLLLLGFSDAIGAPKQSISIGFIINKSRDKKDYDYLESVLQSSITTSITNISTIPLNSPDAVKKELAKNKIVLKRNCTPQEVREAAKKIKTDFFIYGDFIPIKDNSIKITLHIYSQKTDSFFTFTETALLSAEIYPFVDKITAVILNYASWDGTYIAQTIPSGRRIALLTSLPDEELNEFYLSFMRAGYKVLFIQNNADSDKIDYKTVGAFFYITTKNNSYNSLSIEAACYAESPNCFADKEDDAFRRLYDSLNKNVDCLIIVGFDKNDKSAWIRGIDLKSRNLVWINQKITGSSIYEVSKKMIQQMQTPLPSPFKAN
ncbi:MAG: hypothetical protein LBT84_05625 [Spirochaetia bacterium]|jgi:hypothetical protein|nr:hypothetical protein [Spirochaetia bacterium]